ncbi:hypothetical protein [Ferruginibacter sp. SUN106]|uniref:hypothetical protein n=1 Tax=Ferruginibacter sp. SUN106 TaxID=2978348 RepID=UPI003D35D091
MQIQAWFRAGQTTFNFSSYIQLYIFNQRRLSADVPKAFGIIPNLHKALLVGCYFKMTLRKLLKIFIGLLSVIAVAIGLTSISHPIFLKWLAGSAMHIGKPIRATVYTNGQVNNDIKVYHSEKYWKSADIANNYIVNLKEFDSDGMLKYFEINLKDKWIGRPIATTKDDYDIIFGHLFQSETGGIFALFQDDMKGFNFNPHLLYKDRQINFNVPPGLLKFDSLRIELQ